MNGSASLVNFDWLDNHKLSHRAFIEKLDLAGDFGKERIVFAAADVEPRFNPRAALPDDDRATGDNLSAEGLKTKPLRV